MSPKGLNHGEMLWRSATKTATFSNSDFSSIIPPVAESTEKALRHPQAFGDEWQWEACMGLLLFFFPCRLPWF
jgi:hypothetical protein